MVCMSRLERGVALAIVAVLVGACGKHVEREEGDAGAGELCTLEGLTESRIVAPFFVCGELALAADAVEVADAIDCVSYAVETQQPFRLFWEVQGIDSTVTAVLWGERPPFKVWMGSYDSLGFGDGAHVAFWTCDFLGFGECEGAAVCPECATPDDSAQFCRCYDAHSEGNPGETVLSQCD